MTAAEIVSDNKFKSAFVNGNVIRTAEGVTKDDIFDKERTFSTIYLRFLSYMSTFTLIFCVYVLPPSTTISTLKKLDIYLSINLLAKTNLGYKATTKEYLIYF